MNLQTIFESFNCRLMKVVVVICLLSTPIIISAQSDTIRYDILLSGLTSTGEYAPFWMHNRNYGKVSSAPHSASLMLGVSKDFNHRNKWFDYGFKASGLFRADNDTAQIYLHELYAKARVLVFDMAAGWREEHLGTQDETLSGGGLLFSQNARPMPKITVGIEHFTPVPFTAGYLEIKGALSHGWFTDDIGMQNALLHHKYVYAKIGGNLPVHLQYGLEHVAQWGGKSLNPAVSDQPSGFKDYVSIFLGRSGDNDATLSDQINALGNHIISQSVRADADVSGFRIGAYWQIVLEDSPIRLIGKTMNTPDGLWGLSVRNEHFPVIQGVLYEYLNTTDQSGPFHDKDGIVYGGNDGYFLNGSYPSGWSYFSRTIGAPFISSPLYNANGALSTQNNRVQVHHFGIEGAIYDYQYRLLASFSKNYGYNTIYLSEAIMKRNTSLLFEVYKQFSKLRDIELGCKVGADRGKLFGNSLGIEFSVRKRADLFNY